MVSSSLYKVTSLCSHFKKNHLVLGLTCDNIKLACSLTMLLIIKKDTIHTVIMMHNTKAHEILCCMIQLMADVYI